jgi:hypothetical protein
MTFKLGVSIYYIEGYYCTSLTCFWHSFWWWLPISLQGVITNKRIDSGLRSIMTGCGYAWCHVSPNYLPVVVSAVIWCKHKYMNDGIYICTLYVLLHLCATKSVLYGRISFQCSGTDSNAIPDVSNTFVPGMMVRVCVVCVTVTFLFFWEMVVSVVLVPVVSKASYLLYSGTALYCVFK